MAGVLEQYGWGVDKVTTHQHWSGKYCPHRTLDRGWNRFLKMVEEEMKPAEAAQAGWKQYGAKWKYVCTDGSFKKNGWLSLSDGSYLFDSDGWMLTGFQTTENGNSFYLDPKTVCTDGSFKKNGWLSLSDGSYLFDSDGWMLTGFQTTENGNSFYLDPKTGRCLVDCELTIKIDDGGRITLK